MIFYLQIFTFKINKNIEFFNICKYSKFMTNLIDPKIQLLMDRSADKGLYVNDDDQDWGSSGMNNIQEDTE
jgi:hypothetical protein